MVDRKDRTISFRVNEDSFEALGAIADERNISLSSVFRDYVDTLVDHEGRVKIVPKHAIAEDSPGVPDEFPPKVDVARSFVREHERLELEAEHLREQVEEYSRHATKLRTELDDVDDEEVVQLEDLDDGPSEFRLGE